MTAEKWKTLARQGYAQDETYEWIIYLPQKTSQGSFPKPSWMQHRDACLMLPDVMELIQKKGTHRGQAYHFMRFCDTFFGDPNGFFWMQWNPNTVRIIEEFFSNKFVSVMGCKNSGKSFALAGIAGGMFLLNPAETKILVTSTTMDSARGKIWGDINRMWDQVEVVFKKWGIPSPGRKMSSPIIRYEVDGRVDYKSGIELIPTQNSSEKQSCEKVQGYKNSTVIFLGDEWDTLPQGLVNTVDDNLSGNDNSRCLAAFNPTGRFTSGGRISKPKDGWDSIDINSEKWETDYGVCIKFDGEKSPNLELGYEKWKGLMTVEKLKEEEEKYGSNKTAGYWTFVRGWFPPTGELECIYSESELVTQYLADHQVTSWLNTPKKIAGLDPAFVEGGDKAILTIAQVGLARMNGKDKRVYEKLKSIDLSKETEGGVGDTSEQVVQLTKKHLMEEGIETRDLGVDVTGAPAFGALLNVAIGTGWLAIHSSSKPTNLPISKSDARKCDEVFDSLMSELWGVGKALVREGQIKGLDATTIEDMIARTQHGSGKRGDRVIVESKRVMKKRTGKSPDFGDSNFLCLHVARVRHGLSSKEKAKSSKLPQEETDLDRFYAANPHMLPPKRRPSRRRDEALETGMVGW